jgi:hypothetical protein
MMITLSTHASKDNHIVNNMSILPIYNNTTIQI